MEVLQFQKLSEAKKCRKRKPFTEETCKKMSAAKKGKTLTGEHRRRISEALKDLNSHGNRKMGYKLPRWSDPHRRRILNISYKDPKFCRYYDLDQVDFTYLVSKMKMNIPLSEPENDRLGMHIYTMILNVLESPKWKKKSEEEREDLLEFACLELIQALPKFDPTLGKKIYSYAFTCCVNAFNLKYRKEKREKNKEKRIQKHLNECFEDYLGEITDGKVNTQELD